MTPLETFTQITEQVARLRPDLVSEWEGLVNRPVRDAGNFLEKNFPIKPGWGSVLIVDAADVLKTWKPE